MQDLYSFQELQSWLDLSRAGSSRKDFCNGADAVGPKWRVNGMLLLVKMRDCGLKDTPRVLMNSSIEIVLTKKSIFRVAGRMYLTGLHSWAIGTGGLTSIMRMFGQWADGEKVLQPKKTFPGASIFHIIQPSYQMLWQRESTNKNQ